MASVVIASGVGAGMTTATGHATQSHLIYAVNSARWWLFYLTSTQTLATAYSSDFVTWTTGATLTLSSPHLSEGRNFGVVYKNISSTDVVHIHLFYKNSNTVRQNWHVRCTISGTTATFGTETQIPQTATGSLAGFGTDGCNTAIASDNSIYLSQWCTTGNGFGDDDVAKSTNVDSGTAWTAGFASTTTTESVASATSSRQLLPLATGNMVELHDSGSTYQTPTQVRSTKWTTSWSTPIDVFGSTVAISENDWCAVRVNDTDIHAVRRSGSNTYDHRRYNASTWAAGATVATQTSKAGAGVKLVSDGTDVYLVIVDSDAANTVRYCKWTAAAGTWGAWSAVETSTQVRGFLTGYPALVGTTIGLVWTQTNGSNFDLVGSLLTLSAPPTVTFPWTVDIGVRLPRQTPVVMVPSH